MARDPFHSGEELREVAGFPALSLFRRGAPGRPLVVFVTGGGVLARIAYGHASAAPTGFLAHWLVEAGHSFLGVSYPLGNAVFPRAFPAFSVQDWAAQTAELVAATVAAHGLPSRVVVLAWSMAGRIAGPLNRRLEERGVGIELFVAMAATPPLPNLLPALDQLQPAASGLADAHARFLPWLRQCLHVQNGLAGAELISDARFLADYAGDFPVNLAATALRWGHGRFVADQDADCADTGVWDYAGFPALAVMTHDSPMDARHALSDGANWALHMVQSLGARRLWAPGVDLARLSPARIASLGELVRSVPERLGARIPGTHLFFLGEPGARATVRALDELRARRAEIEATLDRLLDGATGP